MTDTCNPKTTLSLVTVGHVDHGKSTLIGRLLADTDSLPEGKLEQVRNFCERNARPFEYAFLLDTLKDEQTQGITIDTTRIFFKTKKRRYMILDAPGHIEFLKNMVAGAAKADAALLVIDAKEGIQENSKRHGILLSMLGVKQFAVVVNKMDLVQYSELRFQEIEKEFRIFLEKLGMKPLAFIPISAFLGENLMWRDEKLMPWYRGLSLLGQIEAFQTPPSLNQQAFRMPVQDVYKFTNDGDDRRIIVGTVASGSAEVGARLVFQPSGKRARIKSFESFATPSPKTSVCAEEAVGICLDEQLYLKRGEVACVDGEKELLHVSRVRASVFWLGNEALTQGKRYAFKLGTERCDSEVVKIERVLNAELNEVLAPHTLKTNETGDCILDLDHTIAVDLEDYSNLNRFVIFDQGQACGGGIIREVLDDPNRAIKAEVAARDFKWDNSLISPLERVKRNGHPGSLILITGSPQAPRKEIAKALEQNLFNSGHSVYYLGFGNLLSGIGAGLSRNQASEQIRMVSEVAQVFIDSGTILIVSMQDLDQEDFQVMRMHLHGAPTRAIWIGEQVTTNLQADQKIAVLSQNIELSVNEIIAELTHFLKSEG